MAAQYQIRPLLKEDIKTAAVIFEAAFIEPWGEAALLDLLKGKGCFGYCVFDPLNTSQQILGFVLCRTLFENGEILTIAVHPEAQGRKLAQKLMQAVHNSALKREAEIMFLEVAVDNIAAIRVYEKLGYKVISTRKKYYRRPDGFVDALNMQLNLVNA